MDGVELLSALNEELGHFVAYVMLTGQGNESIAVNAMRSGAHDYLVKGDCSIQIIHQAIHEALKRVNKQRQTEEERLSLKRMHRQLIAELEQARTIQHSLLPQNNVTLSNAILAQNLFPPCKSVEIFLIFLICRNTGLGLYWRMSPGMGFPPH